MRLVTRLLRLIFLLLLTPVLLLLGCQSRLIYYPRGYDDGYRQMLASYRGLALPYETGQGRQVAHYIAPRDGDPSPKKIWVCFGGNGTVAFDWISYLYAWDPDFAYLLVDYPGYGDCKGTPSPQRIRDSSKAAVQALTTHLKLTPEEMQPRLHVIAHSIGCAAGLMAADDLHIQKLVLISPFTTMTEMGKRVLGWPLCYVNMHRFDNRKHLAHVVKRGAKVTIYHGTADNIIPVEMSRELAEAHPGKVTLHEKEGWDHNEILQGLAREIGETMRTL